MGAGDDLEAVQSENVVAEISQRIKDVERAAKDWGVQTDQMEGRFVAALLSAISALGRLVAAAIGDVRRILSGTKEAVDAELQKLREYNWAAAYSIAQAEAAKELVITRVAEGLSLNLTNRLIDGSRDFLVLKETAYNRRQAWKLSGIVSVCALLVFGLGYELRAFQDDPVTSGVTRCVDRQLMGSLNGKFVPICTMKDLTAQRAGSLGERLMAYFWYGGLDYADMAKAGKS